MYILLDFFCNSYCNPGLPLIPAIAERSILVKNYCIIIIIIVIVIIIIIINRGESIAQCGTPWVIGQADESVEPQYGRIVIFLSDSSWTIELLWVMHQLKLGGANKIEWLILSNALDRSSRTRAVTIFLSIVSKIASVTNMLRFSVE